MLCVEQTVAPGEALLFINIAPRTLDLDADRDGWLVDAVERSEIDTDRVVIEVTERFGGRMASVVKSLERLRAAGLKLAVDDLGTGNSVGAWARRSSAQRRPDGCLTARKHAVVHPSRALGGLRRPRGQAESASWLHPLVHDDGRGV